MPPVDFKPSTSTRSRRAAAPVKKAPEPSGIVKKRGTKPNSNGAQQNLVTLGGGSGLDSDVNRMRSLAGANGPGGNSLNVPQPSPRPDNSPAGPNGPGGNSLGVPSREVDPTTDPNHPAGPNGPGGNSLAIPDNYDPTTDPNHPAGPNGPGGNSLAIPPNETLDTPAAPEVSETPETAPAPETPAAPASDEPFIIPDGDEDNPYEGHNATSVTVTPWDGHGEDGSPNDSISSILVNQGYTVEEIFAKDESGQSLVDQVAQANDIENPDIIHAGDDLVVPTRSNPTEIPEETTPPPAVESTPPATESPEAYDPTTDPNHPAGPNGPGGNSLGIPTNYDPTTDPNHPAGPNGPGGNSL